METKTFKVHKKSGKYRKIYIYRANSFKILQMFYSIEIIRDKKENIHIIKTEFYKIGAGI